MRMSTIIGVAVSASVAAGAAADTATENMIQMYSDPNEFYLFDESSVEVLDYKAERDVRICMEARRHHVALEVDYDGKSALVRPGDCFMFEAMHVAIKPAGDLGDDLDLKGTIETRGGSGHSS